jgi:hypothetical protein
MITRRPRVDVAILRFTKCVTQSKRRARETVADGFSRRWHAVRCPQAPRTIERAHADNTQDGRCRNDHQPNRPRTCCFHVCCPLASAVRDSQTDPSRVWSARCLHRRSQHGRPPVTSSEFHPPSLELDSLMSRTPVRGPAAGSASYPIGGGDRGKCRKRATSFIARSRRAHAPARSAGRHARLPAVRGHLNDERDAASRRITTGARIARRTLWRRLARGPRGPRRLSAVFVLP